MESQQSRQVVVNFPSSASLTNAEILERLHASNPKIGAATWIVKTRTQNTGETVQILFDISQSSATKLENVGFKVKFGEKVLTCQLKKPRKKPAAEKKAGETPNGGNQNGQGNKTNRIWRGPRYNFNWRGPRNNMNNQNWQGPRNNFNNRNWQGPRNNFNNQNWQGPRNNNFQNGLGQQKQWNNRPRVNFDQQFEPFINTLMSELVTSGNFGNNYPNNNFNNRRF